MGAVGGWVIIQRSDWSKLPICENDWLASADRNSGFPKAAIVIPNFVPRLRTVGLEVEYVR